ncbi:hypothetical protein, conserved [Leishmania tarentolae]|uniref:Uncharacterized protein n=1 Tax=Leishmania tarentolae TaxID=5689 RepID=A0A640KDC3_LEITA|nr:hypothetical protein, conserved [Leishmania tarentolae]
MVTTPGTTRGQSGICSSRRPWARSHARYSGFGAHGSCDGSTVPRLCRRNADVASLSCIKVVAFKLRVNSSTHCCRVGSENPMMRVLSARFVHIVYSYIEERTPGGLVSSRDSLGAWKGDSPTYLGLRMLLENSKKA